MAALNTQATGLLRPRNCVMATVVALLAAPGTPSVARQPQTTATTVSPSEEVDATKALSASADAGIHDTGSIIEWWYINAFLTTNTGHHFAVVGAFFRSGLSPKSKGHYLIFSLADLDTDRSTPSSVIDRKSLKLLTGYMVMQASARPDDPAPMRLLQRIQTGTLPAPHRALTTDGITSMGPLFSLDMGENRIAELSPDGRKWQTRLTGDDYTLDMSLEQPTLPPMLVAGDGNTGVDRRTDMHYYSLTHMDATGDLVRGGVHDKVTGMGWLDRQWGSSWGVRRDIGWDWFGLHLPDGSDVIVYRLRNAQSGATVRAVATREMPDGTQHTSTPVLVPMGAFVDPRSHITFPAGFTITVDGLPLRVTPRFPDQVIPVLIGGNAIWEGVVDVESPTWTTGDGRGYMELVGYPTVAQ